MGGIVGTTTYPGRNMNTQVSGGPDLTALYAQMMQAGGARGAAGTSGAAQDPDAKYRKQLQEMQLRAMRGAGNRPEVKGRNPVLEQAQLAAQLAQLRTISGTVPQRQLTGFNMQGATPDVAAFTGAQRAAFLPQGSNVAAPGQAGLGPSGASLLASPPNVAPAGAYSAGIPNMGAVPGNPGVQGGSSGLAPGPEERPDWFGHGTTSLAGQRQGMQNRRNETAQRAQQEALLMMGADPLAVFGMGGR